MTLLGIAMMVVLAQQALIDGLPTANHYGKIINHGDQYLGLRPHTNFLTMTHIIAFFKSFLTVFLEPYIVIRAVTTHKADKLPENYWRFQLIRPFYQLEKPSEIDSPLVRNFCPLFWVTNLLVIAYLLLGWIVLLGLGARGLHRGIKKLNRALKDKRENRKLKKTRATERQRWESQLVDFTVCAYTRLIAGQSELKRLEKYLADELNLTFVDLLTCTDSKVLTKYREITSYSQMGKLEWVVCAVNYLNFRNKYRNNASSKLLSLGIEFQQLAEAKVKEQEEAQKREEARKLKREIWNDKVNGWVNKLAPASKSVAKWLGLIALLVGGFYLAKFLVWTWPFIVAGCLSAFHWMLNPFWNFDWKGLGAWLREAGKYVLAGAGLFALLYMLLHSLLIVMEPLLNKWEEYMSKHFPVDPNYHHKYPTYCAWQAKRSEVKSGGGRFMLYIEDQLECLFLRLWKIICVLCGYAKPWVLFLPNLVMMFFSNNCPPITIDGHDKTNTDKVPEG